VAPADPVRLPEGGRRPVLRGGRRRGDGHRRGERQAGKTITALSLFGLLPQGARVTGSIGWTESTDSLSGKQLRAVRGRQIAMVSQDPATSLHPILRSAPS